MARHPSDRARAAEGGVRTQPSAAHLLLGNNVSAASWRSVRGAEGRGGGGDAHHGEDDLRPQGGGGKVTVLVYMHTHMVCSWIHYRYVYTSIHK